MSIHVVDDGLDFKQIPDSEKGWFILQTPAANAREESIAIGGWVDLQPEVRFATYKAAQEYQDYRRGLWQTARLPIRKTRIICRATVDHLVTEIEEQAQ